MANTGTTAAPLAGVFATNPASGALENPDSGGLVTGGIHHTIINLSLSAGASVTAVTVMAFVVPL